MSKYQERNRKVINLNSLRKVTETTLNNFITPIV